MQDIKNVHTIFQIEQSKIPGNISTELLDALTASSVPIHFGIKRDNYYMMSSNRAVNNFQGTQEVESFNTLLRACTVRGFSLIMINFK